MQDEVNTKVVALSIKVGSQTARLTASALKAAMRKYLEVQHVNKQKTVNKTVYREANGVKHGKQTVGQLMDQNQGLTNIEVTNQNIRSFERTANKYHIDYALKKDKTADPPRYLVFFKARDLDVMTVAFKEFSAKELARNGKPTIRQMLVQAKNKALAQNRQREKVKTRERGQEL